MKVLWYSDFLCGSGFARVAHEVVSRLHASGEYEFHVLGIGHHGEPANHPDSPYYALRDIPVHPVSHSDPRGEQRLLQLLSSEKFDALFILANPWDVMRVGPKLRTISRLRGFKIVFYFPIEEDCDPLWVRHAIGLAHRPVAYTHFGAEQVKAASGLECPVIYHGVNADMFRPLCVEERDEIRKGQWGVGPEHLVLLNVNRNQPRKDLPRSMLVAAEVAKKQGRPVTLHLHCDASDPAGSDLWDFQRRWITQHDVQVIYGRRATIDDERLAHFYAAADVLITTSVCEGWGLSTIEAMAAGLPVVAPNCSVFPELLGHGERGQLVATEGFTMLPGQSGIFRTTHVAAMAECIVDSLREPAAMRRSAAERARAWVLEHCNWDSIAHQWHHVLQSVRLERQQEAASQQTAALFTKLPPVDSESPSQVE